MYNYKNFFRKIKFNLSKNIYEKSENNIAFLNFYGGQWFQKFVEYHFPEKQVYDICFSSVNGKRTNLKQYKGKKIFWTGENVETPILHDLTLISANEGLYWWFNYLQKLYGDYRNTEVELCMGYGDNELKYDNYLRFPLWIIYNFPPNANYNTIKTIVGIINHSISKNLKEAVCINKHDVFGIRSKICDDLTEILNISYPGKWRHNDDDLWNKFNNNKHEFINLFKFNICAENMDVNHYCTEKIFDSLRCGCIPIYAGANNEPEIQCLNQDFIIKWDLDDKYNTENKKLVMRLLKDDNYYHRFIKQEKLKQDTIDYVMDRFLNLKSRIGDLL